MDDTAVRDQQKFSIPFEAEKIRVPEPAGDEVIHVPVQKTEHFEIKVKRRV